MSDLGNKHLEKVALPWLIKWSQPGQFGALGETSPTYYARVQGVVDHKPFKDSKAARYAKGIMEGTLENIYDRTKAGKSPEITDKEHTIINNGVHVICNTATENDDFSHTVCHLFEKFGKKWWLKEGDEQKLDNLGAGPSLLCSKELIPAATKLIDELALRYIFGRPDNVFVMVKELGGREKLLEYQQKNMSFSPFLYNMKESIEPTVIYNFHNVNRVLNSVAKKNILDVGFNSSADGYAYKPLILESDAFKALVGNNYDYLMMQAFINTNSPKEFVDEVMSNALYVPEMYGYAFNPLIDKHPKKEVYLELIKEVGAGFYRTTEVQIPKQMSNFINRGGTLEGLLSTIQARKALLQLDKDQKPPIFHGIFVDVESALLGKNKDNVLNAIDVASIKKVPVYFMTDGDISENKKEKIQKTLDDRNIELDVTLIHTSLIKEKTLGMVISDIAHIMPCYMDYTRTFLPNSNNKTDKVLEYSRELDKLSINTPNFKQIATEIGKPGLAL